MSSESFIARRNGYLNSQDRNVAPDNGELEQCHLGENDVDSSINQDLQLVDEKVNDAQIISKT